MVQKYFLDVFEIIRVFKNIVKNNGIKIQEKKNTHEGEPGIWSSFSPEALAACQTILIEEAKKLRKKDES